MMTTQNLLLKEWKGFDYVDAKKFHVGTNGIICMSYRYYKNSIVSGNQVFVNYLRMLELQCLDKSLHFNIPITRKISIIIIFIINNKDFTRKIFEMYHEINESIFIGVKKN